MNAGHLRRSGALSAESFLIIAIAGLVGTGLAWSFLNGKTEDPLMAETAWGDYPNQVMDGLMNGGQSENKPFLQLPEIKLPEVKMPDWKLPQLPQVQPQQPQPYYDYQPEMRYPQPPCQDFEVVPHIYGPDEITCYY